MAITELLTRIVAGAASNRESVREIFDQFPVCEDLPLRAKKVREARPLLSAVADECQVFSDDMRDIAFDRLESPEDYPHNPFNALRTHLRAGTNDAHNSRVVVHYRGVRSKKPKATIIAGPNQGSEAFLQKFLGAYESVQNGARHTLNSVLAHHAKHPLSDDAPHELLFLCRLEDGNRIGFQSDDAQTCRDLVLGEAFVDRLFCGRDGADAVVEALRKLSDMDPTTKESRELAEGLRGDLEWYRKTLERGLRTGELAGLEEQLRALAASFLLGEGETGGQDWNPMAVFQLLQGIGVILRQFGGSLLCLISIESSKANLSCSAQTFMVFRRPGDGEPLIPEPLVELALLADYSERYVFRELLKGIEKAVSDFDRAPLERVLQSNEWPERITRRIPSPTFAYSALAAVIRMAQVIRPIAVHEGRELRLTFILGHRHHIVEGGPLSSKSEFQKPGQEHEKNIIWQPEAHPGIQPP